MNLKQTVLHGEHLKLKAKMVPFGGWDMPVSYGSIVEEHNHTRTGCSLFDVSHMGEFLIKGEGAGAFLQSLIPTRMEKLYDGFSMYSVFTNKSGGVIDDLFIYQKKSDEFFLVVNAGTMEKDFAHLAEHSTPSVQLENISDTTAKIDIQGPLAKEVIGDIFPGKGYESLKRFHFTEGIYDNTDFIISQSGYTGEHGYEIYIDNRAASKLWREILEHKDVQPAGLGARDSLRLESCYSLYGHELSDEITPVEGGIGWIVSSEKEYPARDILVKQKADGAPRVSAAVLCTGKGVPREGYPLLVDGEKIGIVTSGGFSPVLKTGIALALLDRPLEIDTKVVIDSRGRELPGIISKKPFYNYNG